MTTSNNMNLRLLKIIGLLGLSSFFIIPNPVFAQNTSPSVLFRTFGQSAGEALSFENVQLDSIAINNVKATIEGTDLTVYKDDAVRIEGRANPGSQVTVTFGERSIKATADYGGSWFVLFSITNMGEGKYVVNAKADRDDTQTFLINLIVGQGNRILEPTSETQKDNEEKIDKSIYIYIATGLGALTFGWFSRVLYEKIPHKRKNDRKK